MGILDGRTALITGGTRGLGRAMAMAFLREGARVAASYVRDEAAAASFLEEASGTGPCIAIKADVSKAAEVQAMFGRVKAELGAPLILVNNAGVIKDGFLMLMKEEDWDRVVEVSLKGSFNCCKAACRGMIAEKYGRIINLVSPSAVTGRAGQCNYSAAKGGVLSLTRAMAVGYARHGVRVNAILPGFVRTPATEPWL
ncbi:MAG TPA: SDR family NAD(P)-dependent oxidoreductase, partial [Nitrospirota bacterium]|nr:SDR family NAD(P)-dependent oxidoreductase [Nitrospirota bacterium]